MFQSTHPHGVRPTSCHTVRFLLLFQSTHPHGVRPVSRIYRTMLSMVSIHAPTWGATVRCRITSRKSLGFNPRTHMGCDCLGVSLVSRSLCFNPRTHMGCDVAPPTKEREERVSIHAPTWGATLAKDDLVTQAKFQSTHPQGVRLRLVYKFYIRHTVSIHAPTWGATPRPRHLPSGGEVSIHAPTWGATANVYLYYVRRVG